MCGVGKGSMVVMCGVRKGCMVVDGWMEGCGDGWCEERKYCGG